MAFTVCAAVMAIFTEANNRWPDRSKASDGTVGDPAHASRTSDHNPDSRGIVHAGDLTHDPAHGVDCAALSLLVVDDPRLKYVIWNRRIFNPSISRTWRPYTGSNPHDHHMHISVISGPLENDSTFWFTPANTGGDLDIMDSDTKDYFDRQFAAVSSKQRRARETQLAQGVKLRRVLVNQGEADADLADLDADLEEIKAELHEEGD